jgi:hypothetical protein
MSDKIFKLNSLLAIVDTIIAAIAILAFVWASMNFEKWWLMLFTLVPLALFNGHSVIVDADIEAARKGSDNHP